jgi:hypothetical protein
MGDDEAWGRAAGMGSAPGQGSPQPGPAGQGGWTTSSTPSTGSAPAPWVSAGSAPAPWATAPVPPGPAGPPPERRRLLPWLLGAAALGAVTVGGLLVADALSSEAATEAGSSGDSAFGAPPAAQSSAGSAVSADDAKSSSSSPSASSSATATAGATPSAPVRPTSVTATCQAPAGVDAAGATITYEPGLTLDGRADTAWRCPGSAVGTRLVYEFAGPVTITSVALVPGYAKVDLSDGTDRFAENRTVTAVSWTFTGGESHVQRITAPQPSLTASKLPDEVRTTRVVLEITGTGNDAAVRDFTAISDVAFTGY